MMIRVAQRGVSPEAQKYAIASGLNELLLEGVGTARHEEYQGRKSNYSVLIPCNKR